MSELRIFGPPGCLDSNTKLLVKRGKRNSGRIYTVEHLYYKFNRLPIPRRLGTNYPWRGNHQAMTLSLTNGIIAYHTISQVVYSGKKEVLEVKTSCGKKIRVTHDHPFKVIDGFKKLCDLRVGDEILCRGLLGEEFIPNLETLVSIEKIGIKETYDIVMEAPFHNYVANGFIVHNTGKSTRLATHEIPDAVDKFGSDRVVVTSFTKTGAEEISNKKSLITGQAIPVDPEHVGTLHALCYRQLNNPEIAETKKKEWNALYPEYTMYGKDTGNLDEGGVDGEGSGDGDRLLSQLSLLRSKMVPPERWTLDVAKFEQKWTRFKEENGYVDFTDMIQLGLDVMPYAPGRPDVIFVDEAQDLTPLQLALVRSWGAQARWIVLVGDDEQASLPGSMVLTNMGEIPVEKLDPTKHLIIAYDKTHSCFPRTKTGYRFFIQPSFYNGRAVNVFCNGKSTKTTHNHPWYVKFNEKAAGKNIIYMIQKGNAFRIGWCQLIRGNNYSHFASRCNLEKADYGWILKVCDTKEEAIFGITTALFTSIFRPNGKNYRYYTQENLYKPHKKITLACDIRNRAIRCLQYFNRDIDFPFYIKNGKNIYRQKIRLVKACNLFPEIMSIPVFEGANKSPKWCPIDKIKRFDYMGTVYGLSVPPYKTYIADGLVTHNCIFSFSGASPDAFLTPQIDDKYKRVLQQSYRVPKAVYKRAMGISAKISKKEPKVYHPRDFEGSVVETMANYKKAEEIVDMIKREIAEDKTVMYLCSCAYMLDPVKIVLREQGVPFHNPFRLTRGDWNPLAHGSSNRTTATDILVSFYEKGPDANFWTVQQFLKWAKYLKVGENGLIRKKGKAGLKALQAAVDQNMEGLETTRYILKDTLTENAINRALDRDFSWFLSNLTVRKISSFDFPLAVIQKGGVDTLFQRPKTIIGTIHSVKGAEADTVILAPDISKKAYFELQIASDVVAKRDEFYRLFYVGMTRAREKLILLRHAKQGGKAYFVGL
jgi:hypothetical protein